MRAKVQGERRRGIMVAALRLLNPDDYLVKAEIAFFAVPRSVSGRWLSALLSRFQKVLA
jgi:hypothetical protein